MESEGLSAWRRRMAAGEPLDVVPLVAIDGSEEPPEADDPEQALGRRVVRVDVEQDLATAYLTFDDGSYLAYASRIDEDGVLLLDRFCPTAADYGDYWVFDDLEGETGPPPPDEAPERASGFDPESWCGADGRTVSAIGWYEEGMQVFLHFEEGGYLTLAARAADGCAYLLGYVTIVEPESDDDYAIFDVAGE